MSWYWPLFTSALLSSLSHPHILSDSEPRVSFNKKPLLHLYSQHGERRPSYCLYDICANGKFVFALEGLIVHNTQHECDRSRQQRGQLTYIVEVAVGPPFWTVSAFQGAGLWTEEHSLVLLPHCRNFLCTTHTWGWPILSGSGCHPVCWRWWRRYTGPQSGNTGCRCCCSCPGFDWPRQRWSSSLRYCRTLRVQIIQRSLNDISFNKYGKGIERVQVLQQKTTWNTYVAVLSMN